MVLIAGVDDAGRGSVIGPIVIAGVLFDDSHHKSLHDLEVKDSKALTPKKRTSLYSEIVKLASKYSIVEIDTYEIDQIVTYGKKLKKLNWLEAKAMAKVINKLKPDIAFVDASDVVANRFAKQIYEMLVNKIKIVSEHHADVKYPIVSAASILAKVHRDKIINRLKNRYGDFGSGYSSDPKTIQFLTYWIKEKDHAPSFARNSWKTIKRLKNRKESS
ncbi:MAG: ribonuclease HII [Candidatus Bathyarchaeota archaeon]|nr:MAG: ribonuclease HII [Candidatus Bathyarchaeota archaeon]